MSADQTWLKENDTAVLSLDEYRHFIKALEWLNENIDKHAEAEWLLLLIRRLHCETLEDKK